MRGSANDIAFEFLPLIRMQALSIEIYPPFASIPDKTKAKLLITNVLARIIEYIIAAAAEKSTNDVEVDNSLKTSRQLNAIDRIEKEVAFAERISNDVQICVEKMEFRMEMKEEIFSGGDGFCWERALIIDAFAIRRKEKVKGRTKIVEVMVWESLMLRMSKNSDDAGKPAAVRRLFSLICIGGRREEEGTSACERSTEVENGKARIAEIVK